MTVGRSNLPDKQLTQTLRKTKYYNVTSSKSNILDYIIEGSGTNISLGQARRLSLGRAFTNLSNMIIADEPTSGLNPILRNECMKTITRAAKDNDQILFTITHNLNSAIKYFDQMLFFNDGESYMGTHKELYSKHKFYRDLCNDVTRNYLSLNISYKYFNINYMSKCYYVL